MSKEKKERIDNLMLQMGLVESREKSKRLIMAGQVFYNLGGDSWQRVFKPGQMFNRDVSIRIKEKERFVSRGGDKLLTALEYFSLDVQGLIVLDIGASTGGFTDCLLQMGALRVYALDVGYGQLHWKLRNDLRIINLERINIRHAGSSLLPELVDLITIDCSFISLNKVLTPCIQFLKKKGRIIALVKPQFELEKGQTNQGVVKSEELQQKAVHKVIWFAENNLGLNNLGFVPSKIKGPKGNQEYLLLLQS